MRVTGNNDLASIVVFLADGNPAPGHATLAGWGFFWICVLICFFVFRYVESRTGWDRNRISTLLWVSATTIVTMSFLADEGSAVINSIAISVGLIYCFRIWRVPFDLSIRRRMIWSMVALLPVTGWILYHTRFPRVHALGQPIEG